jgi:eukaryotic-like serine/threonine-protein kinase
MPYYDQNLRNLIDAAIPETNVLHLFSQMLDGLEAAHFQHVWHRDIKPENILYNSASKELAIADFGIAHFAEPLLLTIIETQPKSRLANFQYAAPEQRERGASVDHRADIYSLGLILNEMFTGKLAHGVDFTRIGDTEEQYSYLDDLVDNMLKQSPGQRTASVADIKRLLIARKNEFVTMQKVSNLKKIVIPEGEIDDPLIIYPPQLMDAKWENDQLTLTLDQHVNPNWVQCFQNPGSHQAILGKGPETFRFAGNLIKISSDGHDAQELINYTKQYINMANRNYKILVERLTKEKKAKEEMELKRNIEFEEKTLSVNKNLQI